VGAIRLQLAAARTIIYEFDMAQESRQLTAEELQLRSEMKQSVFGLSSLCRTMARQHARTRQLRDGDGCTRYFHLQACHRRRKNYLFAINHNGKTFSEEEAKTDIVFSYYNELLGTKFPRTRMHRIDLSLFELPQLELADQAAPFSADEIASIVSATPSNHAPGPDGFSGTFL
jgi:hypothetical protein